MREMTEAFQVVQGQDGAWSVVGELDIATSPRLVETMKAHAPFSGDLRLDLRELRFLDSQGIHALLQLTEIVGEGRKLVLIGSRPEVRKVLDLVRLGAAPGIALED
jgi:anti-anti-sigma factor